MSSDDCYDCGKSFDADNVVHVCRDCAAPFTEFVDSRKSKHAALHFPLWRLAALIVLWHGLDWVGQYVHWWWMGFIF